MGFKRSRYTNNDALLLLKYTLVSLLVILLPVTLFLTAFSWYGSLAVNSAKSADISNSTLFFKNSLIFGTIGLMTSIVYFFIFLGVRLGLIYSLYKWKKWILVLSILAATIIFLIFEIFSIIFMGYFYSWQLSIVLIFWPLLYVVLTVLLLIDYFVFFNEQKSFVVRKNHNVEKDLIFRN